VADAQGRRSTPPELPSGGVLRETYFIFDGAKDITTSKLWIKIQRPYIGSVETGKDFKVILDFPWFCRHLIGN
jgi:hypothetical protein